MTDKLPPYDSIERLPETELEPDDDERLTEPYTLNERMAVARYHRQIREERQEGKTPTGPYTLNERMICARVRHETSEQRELSRVYREIDELLKGTRPSAHQNALPLSLLKTRK